MSTPGYPDLQQHLAALEAAGLLLRIDVPVDKDRLLHPLVRWQFCGGLPEEARKAFLFTHVTDATGRRYEFPVVVGSLAANAEIYRIGLGLNSLDDVAATWARAMASPIPPVTVSEAACQEVVITGDALRKADGGLASLPVPISTPGFDVAPYLTATAVISRDPDSGVQNMGTYRGCLKSSDRLGVMMSNVSGGREHWFKYKALGQPMPVAFVVGCPPVVSYVAPQRLPKDVDEMGIAGGLVGEPIRVVRGVTIDLLVPAEAEFIIEGLIRTDVLEPEGPFGESHGHIALEEYSFVMDVTAITHCRNAVFPSIISQVTPSESSVIKRVAYEPLFLGHLRDTLGIADIRRVFLHEPLTNLRPVIILVLAPGTSSDDVWKALNGAASFQPGCGKWVIAVDEDIDPANGDALLWALAYRTNPELDTRILHDRDRGHGPRTDPRSERDSAMLIDATRKGPTPPLALPERAFMEEALTLWNDLGLPPVERRPPWHGYEMGLWNERWEQAAQRAVAGDWAANGLETAAQQRPDAKPGAPVEY